MVFKRFLAAGVAVFLLSTGAFAAAPSASVTKDHGKLTAVTNGSVVLVGGEYGMTNDLAVTAWGSTTGWGAVGAKYELKPDLALAAEVTFGGAYRLSSIGGMYTIKLDKSLTVVAEAAFTSVIGGDESEFSVAGTGYYTVSPKTTLYGGFRSGGDFRAGVQHSINTDLVVFGEVSGGLWVGLEKKF